MKDVKCECGHVNPHGTILCEACGRILEEHEKEKKLVDMRYEGSARRSQTYNKTIVDKVWNFFSSVKVGVWLIVITLVASALGTILPQEMYIPPVMPANEYYEDQYGWIGKLYYELGFHNLYSSWWYLILIASIGISLVICSLDRVIPLYRALKAQRVTRHEGFLKRQRLFGISEVTNLDHSYEKVKEKLKAKRYNIREEEGNILAEKGRFSRWGPYVNHIGLIIFLIGGMLRFVPGMYVDKVLWLREGETKVIPETHGEYYLKNDRFILEVYEKDKDKEVFDAALEKTGMVAKNFQSNVTLYKRKGEAIAGEKPELEKVKDYEIRVNDPLKFESFALYQVEYKLDELNKMTFALANKQTNEEYGNLTVDLFDPKDKYDLGKGYSVEVMSYFPDFEFDKSGEPITKSRIPNNPAFVFKMITPDKPEGEISFVAIRQTIEPFGDNNYKIAFKGVETKNVTALTVRKDLTLWIIALGGLIFMIGVAQGSYWTHRRIWVRRINGEVWVAGHTNKNWHGLKREIQAVLEGTSIKEPLDQTENEKTA
ncbi:cytochrome c biogenesis protein ResB [Bacillus sp. DTU_2020_1000418_1_SI_GHA_SEK_038]|uniref:cytochrome c biogenesis protein ResB n=1 Tax=Bacillus sp. DTU_2020_1000418_1_SI_GHA_SEK_038 TaxID=3077585 RepID=UPI0028E90F90|nr:cytochrome c biogenesis protein ResB [Bacillus sp. DTU_2020_1000418_1_SI_GHA_SEK_038]WNS74083.1 cytochrome c biogenesis protein ResB [Bacillus sp. DTU_2020_1000418_1_SI_GHA_SEK_038]